MRRWRAALLLTCPFEVACARRLLRGLASASVLRGGVHALHWRLVAALLSYSIVRRRIIWEGCLLAASGDSAVPSAEHGRFTAIFGGAIGASALCAIGASTFCAGFCVYWKFFFCG